MKKVLSLLLVLALSISVTACGSGSKKSTDQPQKTEATQKAPAETKKISLWFVQVDKDRTAMTTAAVERFKKDHPGVEVEVVATESTPYKTKLKVALGADNPPDIFHSWGGGWLEAFVKEGAVADITQNLEKDGWKNTYIQTHLDMAKYNNKNYGVPYEISAALVWYNTEIFKKYNLQAPKTWDEFKKVVKTLKDNNIIPLSTGNKGKWPGSLAYIYLADRLGGSDLFKNAYSRKPGFGFDHPDYIQAGKLIQELVAMGAYADGMNGINNDTGGSRALLYTGKAAMDIQTSGLKTAAKSENPEFYKKLDFFPFPVVEGGKGDPSDMVGGVNVYSISSKSKNKDIAVELIKYLSDSKIAQERADKVGVLSAVPNLKLEEPMLQRMAELLSKAKNVQNYYDQSLPPEIAQVHLDSTQALFGKSMSPEDVAKKTEEKAKEVLK